MTEPPSQSLPPATTTKNSLRAAASGFFAQRGRQVRQESVQAGVPEMLTREQIGRMVEDAYAEERTPGDTMSPGRPAPVAPVPRKVPRRPLSGDPSAALYADDAADVAPEKGARVYRLSELVERVKEAKRSRRAVVQAGDPDGPDEGGYDPRDIIREVRSQEHGAGMAASVLGALNERRGR
jgi:hypothetical protein